MESILSQEEIRRVANALAEIIMPQVKEFVKSKAEWTVRELSALSAAYLSVKELAELFHVSEKHIRNLLEEGLPHIRVGTSIRIERSLIKQAIAEGRL